MRDLNYRFIEGCERLIREYGILRLGSGIGGVIAVLAALGLLHSLDLAGTVLAAGFVAWLFLIVLALLVDRHHAKTRLKEEAFILNRYAESLDLLQTAEYFDIVEWNEVIKVDGKGNANIMRRFTLRIGTSEMPAFSSTAIIDPPPTGHAYKKKVRIETGHIQTDDSLGGRVPHSYRWSEHSVKVYLHLSRSGAPGTVVRLYLRVRWPGYFEAVREGVTVPNEYRFHRNIERFSLTILLKQKFFKGRAVIATPIGNIAEPIGRANESGDYVVEYQAANPGRGTAIGFDLAVRDRQSDKH